MIKPACILAASMFLGMTATCDAADQGKKQVTRKVQAPQFSPIASERLVQKMFQTNQLAKIFNLSPKQCAAGSSCTFDVDLTETVDSADTSVVTGCVLKTYDIEITNGYAGAQTNITLNMKYGTVKATYAFQDPGMIVVKEDVPGVLPPPNINFSDKQIAFRHIYRGARKKMAWYFPIAVQSIDGTPAFLCGAGDPKIVNS